MQRVKYKQWRTVKFQYLFQEEAGWDDSMVLIVIQYFSFLLRILPSQGRRIKAVPSVLYESACLGSSSKMNWGNKSSLYVNFCSCYVLMICFFLNFKFSRKYVFMCLRYHLTKLKEKVRKRTWSYYLWQLFFSRGGLKLWTFFIPVTRGKSYLKWLSWWKLLYIGFIKEHFVFLANI